MTTIHLAESRPPFVLTIDIGTSSLRAMLFDAGAHDVAEALVKIPYHVHTTNDGGVDIDAEEMFGHLCSALDNLFERLGTEKGGKIAGVAFSSLAANILGEDAQGNAITPVYTYADTRSAAQVAELATLVDVPGIYKRTGAPMHTGYWPARFRWLAQTQPDLFRRVARWRTLDEHFCQRLTGRAYCSYSMASWSGMLDQTRMDWDAEWLNMLPITRSQLPELADSNLAVRGLRDEFARRWPALAQTPFLPAFGDGATSNIGCGATNRNRAALTVGTSGAMRVVVEGTTEIPDGLWLYRVDKRRGLLGGSLSNGGNVYSWMNDTLRLPEAAAIETALAGMDADAHGLAVLPFFAGERSPGYRADARAAIVGLGLTTQPLDILRAGLEAVAYRFALISELLGPANAEMTIANGGALLNSPAWVQIMADVLGHPVVASGEAEASSRGAALLGMEALGIIDSVEAIPAALGETFTPDPARHGRYELARERQRRLYERLVIQGI